MGAVRDLNAQARMASRWRRRRMCVLIADSAAPAALREVSASGAFLETAARPAVGTRVELRHPEAGSIDGEVRWVSDEGIALIFTYGERSVAFALSAITADMSRPTA